MASVATIEICTDHTSFSAGHFIIFSNLKRENLHGHNYIVHISLTTEIGNEGMTFDYHDYEDRLNAICQSLHTRFLLPNTSPHMRIESEGAYYNCYYADEKIPFLKRDVVLMPMANISLEELSHWFLKHFTEDQQDLKKNSISAISVKISSTPGRWGGASWVR
ncbi:6-carboxytetrahydropterin synthase [soil metagenome]